MLLDMETLYTGVKATGVLSQDITDTAASTNIFDHGAVPTSARKRVPDPHLKGEARIFCRVVEDFATCDSLTVAFQTCATADGEYTTLRSQTVLLADLVAGKNFELGALRSDLLRYSRLYFTVAGSTATAGSVVAGLIIDDEVNG